MILLTFSVDMIAKVEKRDGEYCILYSYGNYDDLNIFEYELLRNMDKYGKKVLFMYGVSVFCNYVDISNKVRNFPNKPIYYYWLPNVFAFLSSLVYFFNIETSIVIELTFVFGLIVLMKYMYKDDIIKQDIKLADLSIIFFCLQRLCLFLMSRFILSDKRKNTKTLLSWNAKKFKNLIKLFE